MKSAHEWVSETMADPDYEGLKNGATSAREIIARLDDVRLRLELLIRRVQEDALRNAPEDA